MSDERYYEGEYADNDGSRWRYKVGKNSEGPRHYYVVVYLNGDIHAEPFTMLGPVVHPNKAHRIYIVWADNIKVATETYKQGKLM